MKLKVMLHICVYDYSYNITTGSYARILRLAAELERKPWAVQIKAFPTATVQVILRSNYYQNGFQVLLIRN